MKTWQQWAGTAAISAVVGAGAGIGTAHIVADRLVDTRVDERIPADPTDVNGYVTRKELGQVLVTFLTPMDKRLEVVEGRRYKVTQCYASDVEVVLAASPLGPSTSGLCIDEAR